MTSWSGQFWHRQVNDLNRLWEHNHIWHKQICTHSMSHWLWVAAGPTPCNTSPLSQMGPSPVRRIWMTVWLKPPTLLQPGSGPTRQFKHSWMSQAVGHEWGTTVGREGQLTASNNRFVRVCLSLSVFHRTDLGGDGGGACVNVVYIQMFEHSGLRFKPYTMKRVWFLSADESMTQHARIRSEQTFGH